MKALTVAALVLLLGCAAETRADSPGFVVKGTAGPGLGKHIVLLSGDQEYRSEESLPQLAKILAVHHGFTCTVLFAIDKHSGEIDPMTADNVPGLEALDTADLMVILMRFEHLPDEQMKHIADYINSGRPMVGMRTATHAFSYKDRPNSPYAKYDWQDKTGGFGRQVLGETWIAHYGRHELESTRGIIAPGMEQHPILKGVKNIWGPSDVYAITTLSGDSKPLVLGEVLSGMHPEDPPNRAKPPVPVAWTKTFTGTQRKTARVFTTTMGHAHDLKNEGVRRLLVNGCYWALGMETQIPEMSNVDLVGPYDPNPIHQKKHKTGLKPADFQ